MEELRRAIRATHAGRGSLILVSGEPGIGKTRLAEEIAAAADGVRVLWGRCHEIEGRPPFWPWVQVLRAHAREIDARQLAASLEPEAMPLAQLVPELRPHLDRAAAAPLALDSDVARFRLFQSMTDLLRRIAAERPLLLILDDLHWADMPSLRLLEFLSHELGEAPIAVVGAYREIEVRRSPELDDVVSRLGRRATMIPLAGLTVDEVAQFVAAASGEEVPAEVAGRLQRETDGNPFFLDEIVRLAREGRGELTDGVAGGLISQGVRGAIQQRLAPLDEGARNVLRVAAVAGREFDLPLLEAALETPRARLIESLAPAIALEIVQPIAGRVGRYRFSHALVNETLREGLPAHQRALLHQRCGDILEHRHGAALDAVLAEIAHHYFEAAVHGDSGRALDYAERAGRQALDLLAYEEAAEQFRRALHLTDTGGEADPRRRCEILLHLGEAQNRAGQGNESVQALHQAAALARRIGSSDLLARAAIGMCGIGSGWTEFGRSDDVLVGILREALEQLGGGDLALRARVLSRLATELYWAKPAVDTNSLSAEAVDLARRSGDASALGYTLIGRLHCIAAPEFVAERERIVEEVLALAAGGGELAMNGYLWRLGNLQQLGRMDEARACGDALMKAVDASRQPGDLWLGAAVRAQRALVEGRLEEAESAIEPILMQSRRKANAEQAAVALTFLVRRDQGRQAEFTDGMRSFAYAAPDARVWRAALSMLYAESGALAEARAELEALAGDGLDLVHRDNGWSLAMACLAVTCSACGSAAHAAELSRILEPYDGENVVGGPFCFLGPVSYYLGILAHTEGRAADAACHLDAALAAARGARARPSIARILVAQARVLRGSGEDDAASALLNEAAALAAEIGLEGVAADARKLLAEESSTSSGAATPSRDATPPPADAAPARRASLCADGDGWLLVYEGRTSRLKNLRGFAYLSILLRSPGEERHVLELTAEIAPAPPPSAAGAVGADLGPALDPQAKAEIARRLRDLRAEVDEAEANADPLRASRARAEIDDIAAAVASSVGLGGRDRPTGAASERARAAVTKAIRAAIRVLATREPGLADILTRTVRTGTFCSYQPLREAMIVWVAHAPRDCSE